MTAAVAAHGEDSRWDGHLPEDEEAPGDEVVRFELAGEQTLDLYWLDGYGGGLYLCFADATSGNETDILSTGFAVKASRSPATPPR